MRIIPIIRPNKLLRKFHKMLQKREKLQKQEQNIELKNTNKNKQFKKREKS